jgi:transcriptional regulator with XRE-family HTH domain
METDPRHVIRTIREALGMSKTEFARALGWAPSTVARWESGRARPSRLALKIILAFGEERGVRYRGARVQLPALAPPRARLSIPALSVEGPEPIEARVLPDARFAGTTAERPRWEAEVRFRVALDRSRHRPDTHPWLAPATAAAAAGAALLVAMTFFTGGSPPPATSAVATPRGRAWMQREAWAGTRSAQPDPDADELAAADRDPSPTATAEPTPPQPGALPEPRAVTARLEGVTLVGSARTATFRTDENAVTIAEGEQLGERQAVRIAVSGVELSDASGRIETVRLGELIAIN